MAIALVETTPSSINYSKYFKFEFDRYALCSDSSKRKILKRDVDIEIDEKNEKRREQIAPKSMFVSTYIFYGFWS